MEWEQLFCSSRFCSAETWIVRQDPGNSEIWRISYSLEELPFTVAATVPVCPRCGETLLAVIEMEGEGALFEFAHSLVWAERR